MERLISATPGTLCVDNPVRLARTALRVDVNPHKARMFGIPAIKVDRTLRLGVAGLTAGVFRDGSGEEYPIRVRLPHRGMPAVEALDRLYVASLAGATVPLRQVADVCFASRPPRIQHHEQQRAAPSWRAR